MSHREFQLTAIARPGIVAVSANSRRSFGRHTHDQYGMGFIEDGAQRSASGRGIVEVGAGTIITVNPGEVHDGAPIGDRPRRWRMLYLDTDVVREMWAGDAGEWAGDFEFEDPACQNAAAFKNLTALFYMLDRGAEFDGLAVDEHLLLALSRLGTRQPVDVPRRAFPPEVLRVRQLLDDDPTAIFSLEDLANECGLSRYQTLRAFSKATGLTPRSYLIQRRVDLARALIRQGHSLVDAAFASGFADQSHMTRIFNRIYGYAPGAYAKALR